MVVMEQSLVENVDMMAKNMSLLDEKLSGGK